MENKDKNYFLNELYIKSDDKSRYKEITTSFDAYSRSNMSRTLITSEKIIRTKEAVTLYHRYNFQETDVRDSKESNIRKLKEKYENHIKIVEKINTKSLCEILSNRILDASKIEIIYEILIKEIEIGMLHSFQSNLNEIIAQKSTISIDYDSLLNYLYILPSKKIQKSEIAIDTKTGKIIIFYNSDNRDFYSKKISIISNAKDFTVSIISRKDGLAKFSGVYASKFPEAYYKIEALMETLT